MAVAPPALPALLVCHVAKSLSPNMRHMAPCHERGRAGLIIMQIKCTAAKRRWRHGAQQACCCLPRSWAANFNPIPAQPSLTCLSTVRLWSDLPSSCCPRPSGPSLWPFPTLMNRRGATRLIRHSQSGAECITTCACCCTENGATEATSHLSAAQCRVRSPDELTSGSDQITIEPVGVGH